MQVPATFDFQRDREPIISLNGVWRFHPGDDPDGKLGWAKPDFDDSSWPLLRANTGWGEQGYKGYTGFAWYRFKVLLPDEHGTWAILLPQLLTSYQVFADTRLIGQFGGMPPHAQYVAGFDQVFALPTNLPSPGHAVTFAIRVWHWPRFPRGVSGGPTSTTRVGALDALRTQQTYDAWGRFWSSSSGNVLMLIPPVPGFAIHCVYKPAGQVGGDFFQVIPLESGGALIALGDVSGKGMPAAMTVSLLVGTFRTLAHYTQRPSEILYSMNRRMLSRSQGGFTTCIVLRVAPQGAVTVANAGHLKQGGIQ